VKLSVAMAALCLITVGSDPAGTPTPRQPDATRDAPITQVAAPEPPLTEVKVGEPAPDFSYQSPDGRWRNLHDLLAQGPVLLVFGGDDVVLGTLEHERDRLLDLGVIPVAILDVRPGTAWSAVRRLHLRYSVLADPQRVIGAQFNIVDPATRRHLPGWFVIDRSRTVRGLERGRLPDDEYPALASKSLGIPLPGVTLPTAQ